ncbi:MAG: high frequency lysogenization protein HflD [Gammaproteobacteria bacterium]|nr:high frequency lysogenization protein HflD [Gammaproteobacteria bacterium]
MQKSYRNQAIALAGLSLATDLVRQLAVNGAVDADSLETLVNSILKVDAESIEDVYGGLTKLRPGFRVLRSQLSGNRDFDRNQGRYAASLIYLENKLEGSRPMQQQIQDGIKEAIEVSKEHPIVHQDVIAKLAKTYENSLSQIRPHVMVQGNQAHLTSAVNINKIRTLLLAGVRSAMLWRQAGGSRWKLLIGRKQLLAETEKLLRAA